MYITVRRHIHTIICLYTHVPEWQSREALVDLVEEHPTGLDPKPEFLVDLSLIYSGAQVSRAGLAFTSGHAYVDRVYLVLLELAGFHLLYIRSIALCSIRYNI